MDKEKPGCDYHENGANVGWKLACALAAAVGSPVLLAAYLLLSMRNG